MQAQLSPFRALARLKAEAPPLHESLAELAPLDAMQRRDIINSFNLGDQAVLQSLDIVRTDATSGRLMLTDFGSEVIDASALAVEDELTADERRQLDELVEHSQHGASV